MFVCVCVFTKCVQCGPHEKFKRQELSGVKTFVGSQTPLNIGREDSAVSISVGRKKEKTAHCLVWRSTTRSCNWNPKCGTEGYCPCSRVLLSPLCPHFCQRPFKSFEIHFDWIKYAYWNYVTVRRRSGEEQFVIVNSCFNTTQMGTCGSSVDSV